MHVYIANCSIILVFCAKSYVPNSNFDQKAILAKLDTGSEINQIRVGFHDNKEILLTVGESGKVCIFQVDDLSKVQKHDNLGESTWSLSISNSFLSLGCNSFVISIFDKKLEKFYLLRGHTNNVPCVDLSPCERFLASVSIDETIRIWDLEEKKEIMQDSFDEWCWGVK
jgi:WD40 repeat protein